MDYPVQENNNEKAESIADAIAKIKFLSTSSSRACSEKKLLKIMLNIQLVKNQELYFGKVFLFGGRKPPVVFWVHFLNKSGGTWSNFSL